MIADCYPITVLPHVSALYRDYLAWSPGSVNEDRLRSWFGAEPLSGRWTAANDSLSVADPATLADALDAQSRAFSAGEAAYANIRKLRAGARAVVTGQQVGLFGGPLLTLLKAATAIARSREATASTGIDHVPVFWLATEDHDVAEVDHTSLLSKNSLETLKANLTAKAATPVGEIPLGPEIEAVLDRASELLSWAPLSDLLRECYAPREGYTPTLGGAFARWMAAIFKEEGLIVMDAADRNFHVLGSSTLRFAIEYADELEEALLRRSEELEAAGYHAQVKVAREMSLLFLISSTEDGQDRQALRRTSDGGWKAGRQLYSSSDLVQILEETPERISPNALLRPVFQDTVLPTAAYIGGPAEVAYFAQSAVLYERILGRITPVLPRLTATLLEPQVATVMDRDEVQLPDAMTSALELGQRLGARAMPIELKRRLAAIGNTMEKELDLLTQYLGGIDASLQRSAKVSGSKMHYQMNRLRRMAATHELERETSLQKHAATITLNVFPEGHPQERVVAGVWYLARYEGLISRLVREAAKMCGGHAVIRL